MTSRYGGGRGGARPRRPLYTNLAAGQIQAYVDQYRRDLYRGRPDLEEEEVERLASVELHRLRALLRKRRERVATAADAPRRQARHHLFQALGPERAAEVLYLAAEAGEVDDDE